MFGKVSKMTGPNEALKGRDEPIFLGARHRVFGTELFGPFDPNLEIAVLGMGCFWGAERIFWQLNGVVSTSVGYSGGFTPNPTYEEVCSGRTGHGEVARIVYDPKIISYDEVLSSFFENHDPTQSMRQGNDVGSQYRSMVLASTDAQYSIANRAKEAYGKELQERSRGLIRTEVGRLGQYYYGEAYHQQYLYANPNGYCNHGFNGVSCTISWR
ncbi:MULTISPECIES: peptide-methionine (S)-S-oxide reductase MsrA [Acidithrix]|uniref:Peptide methionine sulfoxide reductase MsrA n=1 Tax=Acidithrix ferrooxidans TaxID=1280514 RepID=A0A0D8HK66_9ACTN|nr:MULTISPECIES: peptide-methionine (S)-S-oxide reductase MsrA [Acidithrix]KJF18274.1 peptide methionine sulfoxide reductase MsrA [Acidithrix ferrooxidans]